MTLPESLQKIVEFMAGPLGIILIIVWMLGGILAAYRRLKSKHNKDKR